MCIRDRQILLRLAGVRNPFEASFGVILGVRRIEGIFGPSVDAANAIEIEPFGKYENLLFWIFECVMVDAILAMEMFEVSLP